MFTNEKIPSNCHDCKHDSKFWNLSRDQKKNSSRHEKKNASRVRETADQLSCQSIFNALLPSQMAFRWLPNIAEFFFSLARLIEDSERQLNSASYDSIEFLVRRLDEYERTLATLTSRFYETYGCVPAQQNTVADLSYLGNRVAFLRSHFQRSLDCDNNSVVVSTTGNIRPLQIEHCNRPGRPRLAITQEQLEDLQRDSGFRLEWRCQNPLCICPKSAPQKTWTGHASRR